MALIMVAESGSTRTEWRVGSDITNMVAFETVGLNPFYVSARDVYLILSMNFPAQVVKNTISKVYFYGAGCWYDDQIMVISDGLRQHLPEAAISVHSDLLGASRALFGSSEGITAILGTGASACFYDGINIFQYVKSLGFILGDEGSGAFMGKELLSRYLRRDLSATIVSAFHLKYSLTFEQILKAVYSEPFPNRFLAAFSEFIHDHRQYPEMDAIIRNSIQLFFERYINKYNEVKSCTMGCVGSVAYYFEPYLREQAKESGITLGTIQKSAVDELFSYHLRMG